MRVRMVTTAAGPGGIYIAGETWELDTVTAQRFVAAGAAVALTVSRETLPAVETATVAAPETAMLARKPRGRK